MNSGLVPTAKLSEEISSFRVLTVGNDNGEQVYLACFEFAHNAEGEGFVLAIRVQNDEDRWHAGVDLGVSVEVVGEAGDGEALAVEIGELLHLQTAFLGNSLGQALAEEENTLGSLQMLSSSLGELNAALQ